MKLYKVILICIVVWLIASPVYSEEQNKQTFSVGIDSWPWTVSKISFRGWNGKRGWEISYGSLRYEEGSVFDFNPFSIYIDELRVNWLRRKAFKKVAGMYLVQGLGVAAGFNGNVVPETREDVKHQHFRTRLTLFLPLGFEHFPIKGFPQMSYSLSLDPYIQGQYEYNKSYDQVLVNRFTLRLGLKVQFYARIYFK